ncbi:MAG: sulfotransferase family protein [Sphingomonadaceae bacterium]|nr:sulfotransferase family protein [Sphingomonadaceae bacterium]NBU77733.1 sulfotransferase family protein [Sphingomonadaceae bacterium]NCA00795.1 sulfotransferase family protein [Sphingomonadaceae bacterium]
MNVTVTPLDSDAIAAKAREMLQKGQAKESETLCQQLLADQPDNRDALYILAVSQRTQRKFAEALATVKRLISINPANGRAHQEQGHCLRDMGDSTAALMAYQNAVAHNRALLASWNMLARLNRAAGRTAAAEFAEIQSEYWSALPPELLTVASLIEEGRFLRAEKLCRAFLQTHGHHVEAMRLLAQIGTQFNVLDEAEFLLESAVELEPENPGARFDYVTVLQSRQKFAQALEQAKILRENDPENPQVEMLYANQSLGVGNFDEALSIYKTIAAAQPGNPSVHLTLGHALKTTGRQQEAIEAYSQAYRVRPDFGDAYWSLANLKTYRFDAGLVSKMRDIEDQATTQLVDRYHLCFAIGKALEDSGDYATSFDYYERGNRLKRDEVGYDWRKISKEIGLQIEHCTPQLFADTAGAGFAAQDPIFILGLPRAGSTLLEQILASHSQVEGTMELPNILALAHKLDGRRRVGEEARYPANLNELSRDDLRAFGEAYLRDTRIHRKTNKPFFIDKMPNNFRHIGLIHMILPNAKIIDARRSAMGCCFSGFKQLFAEGQEFTYGLEEIGHYYKDYVALMDHWDKVLPGKVLKVQYEDVVDDLETQVRRVLDFCGLDFEEACINFHQTERAVRTASSEQVRQPLFRSGVDQWENFSPYLDPLRDVLGPELAR